MTGLESENKQLVCDVAEKGKATEECPGRKETWSKEQAGTMVL